MGADKGFSVIETSKCHPNPMFLNSDGCLNVATPLHWHQSVSTPLDKKNLCPVPESIMSTEVELHAVGSQQETEQATEEQPDKVPVENNVQGLENPAFQGQEQDVVESELSLPPMTFVDFLPALLEKAVSADDTPRYAEFRYTIMSLFIAFIWL